jgi:predicted DNA-binding transcriptional regulator AlpA
MSISLDTTDRALQPRERLIPLDEAAEILGVERSTLWSWRSRGEGPASFRIGGRKVVYRSSVLDAYIAAGEAADDRT